MKVSGHNPDKWFPFHYDGVWASHKGCPHNGKLWWRCGPNYEVLERACRECRPEKFDGKQLELPIT